MLPFMKGSLRTRHLPLGYSKFLACMSKGKGACLMLVLLVQDGYLDQMLTFKNVPIHQGC